MIANGRKPHTEPASLALLEAQLVSVECAALKVQTRLLEGLIVWDDFGGSDLYDRLRSDSEGGQWIPLSVPSDRRHGANWPFYRSEPELDRIRQRSRLLCGPNSYATGLLLNLTNYVIGIGFSYKAALKKEAGDGNDQVVKDTQACIDGFCKLNHWGSTIDPLTNLTIAGSRERETFRRVKRDGEAFIRDFPQEDGTMLVRFVEPERVRTLPGGIQQDGWSFGMRHQMTPFEDVETVLEYHIFNSDPTTPEGPKTDYTGELVPAENMLHLKGPDTDGNLARGLPFFIWDTAAAFERASKLQRNLSIGAQVRAATAEIWQHATATRAQLESFQGEMTDFTRVDPQTQRTEKVEKVVPGQVRRIPAGQTYVPVPPDNTPAYIEGVGADLRQGATAGACPEFIVSSDASNADYSSTKEAGAPFVKNGEVEQEYYKAAFLCVIWKAIRHAVNSGKLDRRALSLIDIQAEPPAVLHRDVLEKSQADQIAVQGGWKSPQTTAMEDGLDPDTEFQNIEEYRERMGSQGQALPLPPEEGDDGQPSNPFPRVAQ